jgi:integrase
VAWTQRLPSGRFQGRYRDGSGGLRSAGTYTQRAKALRESSKAEAEQRKPGAIDPRDSRQTWGAWWDSWHTARILAHATDETYRSTVERYIRPTFGPVRLGDVTALDVQRWIKSLQRDGASPYVIRNALMLLKTSLNAAVEAGRLGANPARRVPMPDLPTRTERFLTAAEVEAITFYMHPADRLIVWTLCQTGLRFGELAGLHWPRLDLDRGVIAVQETYDQKALAINPTPKDKDSRTVPLPDDLAADLAEHAERCAPGKRCGVRHVSGRCVGDLVFRGPRGAPLRSSEWGRGPWARALGLAGIEGRVRVHDCRHTYASWLLQEGRSIAEVAAVMGHSSWEVTARYSHLADDSHDRVRAAVTRRGAARSANPRSAAVDEDASGNPGDLR